MRSIVTTSFGPRSLPWARTIASLLAPGGVVRRRGFAEASLPPDPGEARLAAQLARDISLTEAADTFGVTRNTVRAQLRSIFDKTEARRQSDLVRLLHSACSLRISLN